MKKKQKGVLFMKHRVQSHACIKSKLHYFDFCAFFVVQLVVVIWCRLWTFCGSALEQVVVSEIWTLLYGVYIDEQRTMSSVVYPDRLRLRFTTAASRTYLAHSPTRIHVRRSSAHLSSSASSMLYDAELTSGRRVIRVF